MAKKKKSEESPEEVKAEESVVASAPEPKAAPAPTPKATPAPKEKPEPLLTFNRYFAHTGRPSHHKAGMTAWLKKRGGLAGRRTVAAWEALFANY